MILKDDVMSKVICSKCNTTLYDLSICDDYIMQKAINRINHATHNAEHNQSVMVVVDDLWELKKYIWKLKKGNNKARSIVAMLFWEWRKADRIIESNAKTRESNSLIARVDERRIAFENAYIMLKDK